MCSIRMLNATTFEMHIEPIDINAAYLHEKFDHSGIESVYVRHYWKFDGSFKYSHLVGKLHKRVYGTPGTDHTCFSAVFKLPRRHKFIPSKSDMCLLHRCKLKHIIILSVSMDDFTIISTSKPQQHKFSAILTMTYNIKQPSEPAQPLKWTIKTSTMEIYTHFS